MPFHSPELIIVPLKCPVCGKPAKRETNTMPQWAGSSWYFLRYVDSKNTEEPDSIPFQSPELIMVPDASVYASVMDAPRSTSG